MQERVGTEDDKNEPEKDARNNGSDFHSRMVARLSANSNAEILEEKTLILRFPEFVLTLARRF